MFSSSFINVLSIKLTVVPKGRSFFMGKLVAVLCLGISNSLLASANLDAGEKIVIESGSQGSTDAQSENIFMRLWHGLSGLFGSKNAAEGSVKHESGSDGTLGGSVSGSLSGTSGSEEPLFSLESESGSLSGSPSGSVSEESIPVFGGLEEPAPEEKKETKVEKKKETKVKAKKSKAEAKKLKAEENNDEE